jgi:glycine oxidase
VSSSPSVAVVGGGIIGCAVAFELAHRGCEVTVYDARDIGAGATQASAGILAPYTEAHADGPLFDLTVRGLEAYEDFVARVRSVATTPFEFRRSGTLELSDGEPREDELRERLEVGRARQAAMQWIDGAVLRELEPAVSENFTGGLLCGVHAYVSVVPFVRALQEGAAKLGARFRPGTRIHEVAFEPGSVLVRSETGRQRADRLVLCTGSFAEALDPFSEIQGRLKPVRGQLLRLRWNGPPVSRVLWSKNCYIVPWQDGTLLVGATSEDVGFDERATVEGVQVLLDAAREVLPTVDSATFEGVRVGLRPATTSGVPLIQPSAVDPRLFFAVGHYRNGILLAPVTARLVADAINGA